MTGRGPQEPGLPAPFRLTVKDSDFEAYAVPASERADVVERLKKNHDTPHWSAAEEGRPCVHVPSAGGGFAADDDGEPEHAGVGATLERELRLSDFGRDVAIVVWRRFGGELLGVTSGGLVRAYAAAAAGALEAARGSPGGGDSRGERGTAGGRGSTSQDGP